MLNCIAMAQPKVLTATPNGIIGDITPKYLSPNAIATALLEAISGTVRTVI